MTRITVSREISAPREVVFSAVTDIARMPDVNADVVHVEFLSEQRSGVGTRFRETRRMGKREMGTDLEITEFEAPRHARMVTDSHGTVWDTAFDLRPTAGGCELVIDMDARAHAFLPKLMNPLLKPMFRRGLLSHLETLTDYCEGVVAKADRNGTRAASFRT